MNHQPNPEQVRIAQEQLSAWLAYPTELETAPDEIEFLGAVDAATSDGPADVFVFRFRTAEPHWAARKGWMIGVAGPYLRALQPTTNALGYTFSRMAREDDKSLEDHVRDLAGIVGRFHAAG